MLQLALTHLDGDAVVHGQVPNVADAEELLACPQSWIPVLLALTFDDPHMVAVLCQDHGGPLHVRAGEVVAVGEAVRFRVQLHPVQGVALVVGTNLLIPFRVITIVRLVREGSQVLVGILAQQCAVPCLLKLREPLGVLNHVDFDILDVVQDVRSVLA